MMEEKDQLYQRDDQTMFNMVEKEALNLEKHQEMSFSSSFQLKQPIKINLTF